MYNVHIDIISWLAHCYSSEMWYIHCYMYSMYTAIQGGPLNVNTPFIFNTNNIIENPKNSKKFKKDSKNHVCFLLHFCTHCYTSVNVVYSSVYTLLYVQHVNLINDRKIHQDMPQPPLHVNMTHQF